MVTLVQNMFRAVGRGSRRAWADRQVGVRRRHHSGPPADAELKLATGSAGASPSRSSSLLHESLDFDVLKSLMALPEGVTEIQSPTFCNPFRVEFLNITDPGVSLRAC
jgi:hypothetical protein